MKKVFFAIAMAMMSIFFAGCDKGNEVEPDRGVAQKIIGKWITAETDSKVIPTNEKIVYDIVSTTEAYVSLSFQDRQREEIPWRDRQKVDIEILGNDVTLSHSPKTGMTVIVELHVNAITSTTMIAKRTVTIRQDGGLVKSDENMVRYEKLNVDYSKDIYGLWEGRMISEQSEYDDGQEHRWEFKEDGTFVFYLKNKKGVWEKKDDEYAQYFVAGNLLCTRWKNAGEGTQENREWWEITALGESEMVWTALREKEDGSQYTAAFTMSKVGVPTQAEVEEAIIGKWMTAELNGKPFLTNDKFVYTFLNTTSAYMSASVTEEVWHDQTSLDAKIKDNVITLSKQDEHKSMTIEMTVTSINANEMHADVKGTLTVDGVVTHTINDHFLYEKVKEHYRKPIRGMWEGRRISGGTTEYHRWEYLEDGTFNYYIKVGEDQWIKVQDEFANYFVDGRLLCTRWKNVGEGTQEYREWWEIRSIENDAMIWTALRQNELGDRYVESFVMTKVAVPTEAEIREHIMHKWMAQKINGEVATTNEKAVFTFFSRIKATISASFNNIPGDEGWVVMRDYDYEIDGNKITLTSKPDEHITMIDEMIVGTIDEMEIHCLFSHKEYKDGELIALYSPVNLQLERIKTPANYQALIMGTWEGRVTSEHSQYDDGKDHRWEFSTNFGYVYYVKDGAEWVPSSNTKNEYFVDGRLLCTRWIDGGKEYREWWEIVSLDEETMIWTALRKNDSAEVYTASFAMKRVAE